MIPFSSINFAQYQGVANKLKALGYEHLDTWYTSDGICSGHPLDAEQRKAHAEFICSEANTTVEWQFVKPGKDDSSFGLKLYFDCDAGDPYPVMELSYRDPDFATVLNCNPGFRGPIPILQVWELMEEDITRIPAIEQAMEQIAVNAVGRFVVARISAETQENNDQTNLPGS